MGLSAAGAALLSGQTATAQSSRPVTDPVATDAPAAPVVPETVLEEARAVAARTFEAGLAAFRQGAYPRAAERFEASYAALPHPFTLYNLARAYESGGRVRRAADRYSQYRKRYPDGQDIADVIRRLGELMTRRVPVVITTTPPGGTIQVDGSVVPGLAPVQVALTPGVHAVQADLVGHRTDARTVTVLAADEDDPQPPVQCHLDAVAPAETLYDRILARRPRAVNVRLAALGGVAWPRDQYVPAIGFEATVFWRRSLAAQVHFLQIETDGTPMVLTGELGWVFVVEDLDLGVFAHLGAVLNCQFACRDAVATDGNPQLLGGITLRADVVLLPRVGVGLFGRFSWRGLDIGNSASLLSSLGLSISFLL